MKSIKIISTSIVILAIFFSGCKKDVQELTLGQKEQNAINQIRNIVGNNGEISVIKNINTNMQESALRLLTIEEFKLMYNMTDSVKYERLPNDEKDYINNKAMYFDDMPSRPGIHIVKYYGLPFSLFNGTYGINNASSPATVLNFQYETDINGRIIGTPLIYYTGVLFFHNWNQLSVSQIQYNPTTHTSTFTIIGTNLYGLNIYGQNIGWNSSGGFTINVNTSPNLGDDGDIRIIGWK